MTDSQLRAYLRDYIEQNGREVRLSQLAKEFEGWKPIYKARGTPKDEVAARAASINRSVMSLYDALLKAVVNEELTVTDADGRVDFAGISEFHGGTPSGKSEMPDYLVRLDDAFIRFTQSLSYTLGGPKTSSKPQGVRSPNSQKLVDALVELEKANGASARKFITTYRELQGPLRLPKLPD